MSAQRETALPGTNEKAADAPADDATAKNRNGRRKGITQHVREALYASMTGIATLLVMVPSSDAFSGRSAAGSLVGTMGGLFAASLVADTVAHAGEHGGAARRGTVRSILHASLRAIEITVVPAVLLLLSDSGIWSLRTGLMLAIAALAITQLGLVLWGLRGSATTAGQKAGYLLLQLVAVGAVVLVKVLVH